MKGRIDRKLLVNYVLIAALVALVVLNSKFGENKLAFWIYIIVMGIAALITRFAGTSASKNRIIVYSRHFTFIGVIALLIMWAVIMTIKLLEKS